MFCQQQAVQLHRERGEIQARGAELHLVGTGSPEQGALFARKLGLTSPVWVDPQLLTFRALHMKRGFRRTLGSPSTWKATARAWRQGLRQGNVQGDPWQLGGVLVVRPDGSVLYRYLSAFAGDHPKAPSILAAVR